MLIIRDDEKVICVALEPTALLRSRTVENIGICQDVDLLDMGDCFEEEDCIVNEFGRKVYSQLSS